MENRWRLLPRQAVEEDGNVVGRYVIARPREFRGDIFFDEVQMMIQKLCAFRVEPFQVDLRSKNERSRTFFEVDLDTIRVETPALASFQILIDIGEDSRAEPKRTGWLIAVTQNNNRAE